VVSRKSQHLARRPTQTLSEAPMFITCNESINEPKKGHHNELSIDTEAVHECLVYRYLFSSTIDCSDTGYTIPISSTNPKGVARFVGCSADASVLCDIRHHQLFALQLVELVTPNEIGASAQVLHGVVLTSPMDRPSCCWTVVITTIL